MSTVIYSLNYLSSYLWAVKLIIFINSFDGTRYPNSNEVNAITVEEAECFFSKFLF
ncbi:MULTISPECIES: hypothetical protein [Bacillus cereus group]|uniref:hypothetical protein n=1 Tax=Bacillus cereus group TaxID=86661 RepID=UPI0015971290|nr:MULTISPECIES: hypothetical protein [Bacillus cereus group]MDR4984569.1 hypothetical protein [Bacillus cereus]